MSQPTQSINYKFLIERCTASLLDCAKNVAEDIDDPESSPQVASLKNIANQYCILDHQRAVRDEMLADWLEENADTDLADLEKKKEQLRKKIAKEAAERAQKGDHPLMKKMNMIFDKRPVPGTSQSDDTLNNSEIIETECTNEYIDPISKKVIEVPVKNKICGHLYDENSIKNFIESNPRVRCPVIGCGNRDFLTVANLIVDHDVSRILFQASLKTNKNK